MVLLHLAPFGKFSLVTLVSQQCNQVVRSLSFKVGQSWFEILVIPVPRVVTVGKSVILFEGLSSFEKWGH